MFFHSKYWSFFIGFYPLTNSSQSACADQNCNYWGHQWGNKSNFSPSTLRKTAVWWKTSQLCEDEKAASLTKGDDNNKQTYHLVELQRKKSPQIGCLDLVSLCTDAPPPPPLRKNRGERLHVFFSGEGVSVHGLWFSNKVNVRPENSVENAPVDRTWSLKLRLLSLFFLDQLGSISTYSLPTGHLCSSYLCWKSLPWTVECCWNHQCLFWAIQSDGEMWSTSWQIHGLLSAVPWWCGTQGCECSYCDNQDQENHSVCRLVSNWL